MFIFYERLFCVGKCLRAGNKHVSPAITLIGLLCVASEHRARGLCSDVPGRGAAANVYAEHVAQGRLTGGAAVAKVVGVAFYGTEVVCVAVSFALSIYLFISLSIYLSV